jgi:citrate lyase beta subunit
VTARSSGCQPGRQGQFGRSAALADDDFKETTVANPGSDTRDRLTGEAGARREAVLSDIAGLEVTLPLRFLRQQATLTAPASNPDLAVKAIESGYSVSQRLLDRYQITAADLSTRLGITTSDVELVLSGDQSAPVVMLDLEDGVAPHMAQAARDNAVALFREAKWGSSLRFLRPPGLADARCVEDLVGVLLDAGSGLPAAEFPVDAIVFPKVRHPQEVTWLSEVLGSVEDELGLAPDTIRIVFLVEAGWALHNLGDLVRAGRKRLVGMVLGTADLSADVQLQEMRYRHPVCEWARNVVVTVAGAFGVPAVDSMTLNFPVAKPGASAGENHDFVLSRIKENFDDTLYSLDRGLTGRWVGHPLQLLATMLAFRSALRPEVIEAEVTRLEEFAAAIAADAGAVASSKGQLLDIATDRHVRAVLRRATAWGWFPLERAQSLGLVDAGES